MVGESTYRDIWFGSYKTWVNLSRFAKPFKQQSFKGINKV